jgi:SNF2 family DNA or RNA helicase
MQNDWDELYAVLDLLCPHCLGEYSGFVDYYSKPIKRGQSSTASEYEVVKVCIT